MEQLELLLLMATALKDLATELQLFLSTSTQVNGKDSGNEIRNESHLAGGRSTINKADYGFIMARPTVEELDILHEITSINGEPNLVIDVYKVRDGKWTQVRIWSLMDLGRLTRKDLFVTDARLNPISNFYSGYEYVVCNWTEEEEQRIMKEMNYLNELSRNYRESY